MLLFLFASGALASCTGSNATCQTDCSQFVGVCETTDGCMLSGGNCVSCPECPCHSNDDCPNPADDGIYCFVRDCWAGTCMNMSIPASACEIDGDACTIGTCIETPNATTYSCLHTPNPECCNTEDDCILTEPCTVAACINFNVTTGHGMCEYSYAGAVAAKMTRIATICTQIA